MSLLQTFLRHSEIEHLRIQNAPSLIDILFEQVAIQYQNQVFNYEPIIF